MATKIDYNAPVVLTFSLICVGIYVLDLALANMVMGNFFTLQPHFSFYNPLDYFRLFSHIFGHAGHDHLLGNLTFILLLGPVLEEKYGSQDLILMMAFTAFITAVLNILLFTNGLLGASGIVFMFIILVSFTNVKAGRIPLTFILIVILFVGKEFLNALDPTNNISEFAHIIGGMCGSIFGFAKARIK